MIWRLHLETPQKKIIQDAGTALSRGEVLIMPTDTVYAFVCSLEAPRAINELYRLKNIPTTQHLSLLCRDVAMASRYARSIPNHIFRFMKTVTPGPFTFILAANREVDRRGTGKKKTVGIRIVDHPLHIAIMEQLDVPLVSTSITIEGEYATDPEDLETQYGRSVHAVLDGGIRYHDYSTILDCTTGDFVMKRKGIGDVGSIDVIEE